MNKYAKMLAASVSAALGTNSAAALEKEQAYTTESQGGEFGAIPAKANLHTSIPLILAAHSSHSSHGSHGSHGSHRSSSGGSGRPVPNYPTPPPVQSQPRPEIPKRKADPLGQRPKPKDSYKPKIPDAKKLTADKELRKRVIMRVQLALYLSGEYTGSVDGILGPQTRDAIDVFKIKNGLKRGGYLDLDTLNALGIPIN